MRAILPYFSFFSRNYNDAVEKEVCIKMYEINGILPYKIKKKFFLDISVNMLVGNRYFSVSYALLYKEITYSREQEKESFKYIFL